MLVDTFLTRSRFGGHVHHDRGPYTIAAQSAIIQKVEKGDRTKGEPESGPVRIAVRGHGVSTPTCQSVLRCERALIGG